ncbi:putative G-protein coupled receptor 33 [Mantella aurantiaca]
MTDLHVNISAGTSHPEVTTPKLISACIMILTSLFGVVVNSLYIWVLRFRMVQSVSTIWFFHLIITNLIFSLDMPVTAAYILRNLLWTLGSFMCKVNNALIEVCTHAAVFFLMGISLERFLLVFHPVWHLKHITPPNACKVCLSLWVLAILCSSPYFMLCNVQQEKNITVCCAEITIYGDEGQLEKIKQTAKWMPKTNRPYKLIGIVIASFFICWVPYHLRIGILVEKGRFRAEILQALVMLTTCFTCVNCCFTPILYLFIVESFSKEVKKSMLCVSWRMWELNCGVSSVSSSSVSGSSSLVTMAWVVTKELDPETEEELTEETPQGL